MSDSKLGLGLSSLLPSSTPKPNLGDSLLSPASPSNNSLGLNPLAPSSQKSSLLDNPLIGGSSNHSGAGLGIGDLLPNSSGNLMNDPLSSLGSSTATGINDESYTLHLSSVGANKVAVVKAIRAHWDKGLKDSKMLADAAPVNLPALPKSQALAAEEALRELGASISKAL